MRSAPRRGAGRTAAIRPRFCTVEAAQKLLKDSWLHSQPESLAEWRDGRATVQLKAFQANAPSHDGLFRPVAADQVQEVSNDDLRSIFRAVVDFGMQRLTQ